ncbi:MAG TPA: hypothetical protein ENH84_03380 [Phycisphaerae bacterium]|nr:hypothetical protein [Phycisphaerae bacterium]
MKKIWIIALTTILAFTSGLLSADQQLSRKATSGKNAALTYWQAFALLPEMSAKEEKILSDCRSAPLDKASKKLVDKGKPSLRMLIRGAKYEYCNWQVHKENGVEAIMPHLSKARTLIKFAILRARWNFHQNKPTEAIDDLMASLALARYGCANGPLISYLVQVAIEALVVQTTAEHLTRLDKGTLQNLAKRLNALPQGASLATAFANEKEFLDAQKDDPLYKSALKLYEELAGMAELPPQEFEEKLKTIKNPALMPGIGKISYQQAAARTKMAMLKAAIAILLEGKEKLRSIRDPYGDGSFEYMELKEGFRLRSSMKVTKGQERVSLTIGGGK